VLELCRIFDHKQSGMSHHLKILASAGLVSTRREGNSIFYRRAGHAISPALEDIQKSLFDSADQLPMSTAMLAGIQAVQAEREKLSRDFFARHAGAFQEQQELIADPTLYQSATAEMLAENVTIHGSVLEVGPGEGALLARLAQRFDAVYALDTSAEMLSQAKRQATGANIHFIHGDTGHQDVPQQVDCIIACMVLHHVPSPAKLVEDMASLLRPGGLLCITDLCPHDQAWAQQSCGDLWLGFEPEDFSDWAAQAGLVDSTASYLAQRNGFQVQVRQFLKPLATSPRANA
jgi:ArsR family transcriptional regulator